MPLIYKE